MWRPSGVTNLIWHMKKRSSMVHPSRMKWCIIQWVAEKGKKIKVWKYVISWSIRGGWRRWVCQGWASIEKSYLSRVTNEYLLNKTHIFGCEKTTKQGWRHHADLTAWFTTQILYCRKIHSPHRVHRGWTQGVDESNSLYTPNTIAPSDFFVWTRYGLTRGECLKKGREVNRS